MNIRIRRAACCLPRKRQWSTSSVDQTALFYLVNGRHLSTSVIVHITALFITPVKETKCNTTTVLPLLTALAVWLRYPSNISKMIGFLNKTWYKPFYYRWSMMFSLHVWLGGPKIYNRSHIWIHRTYFLHLKLAQHHFLLHLGFKICKNQLHRLILKKTILCQLTLLSILI